MSSAASASSSSDPRRPDRIVEYKPEVKRIEDDDPDVPGFVALVLAVVGLMIRLERNANTGSGGVGGDIRYGRISQQHSTAVEATSYQRLEESPSHRKMASLYAEGGLMGSPAATILFSISSLVMNYLPELVALYSGVKI
ncbi:hypothetical protein KVV02_007813 [Mortierella alpina]|uniref:Uncharacterized protein n=1 Tax=Mortierella alpina TaxID=64518 RepID=A0A9P8A2C4_MORAP|nr:hypothetical protein KVV02_007813 [Mortierella alpina]